MIRLIASDIDGTLLSPGMRTLDPVYLDLIREMTAQKIRFVAASGRQYTNLRRLFAPVADEIDYICENGSLIVSSGKVLYKQTVERTYGERLLRALYGLEGCEPLLSGVMRCYVQPKNPAYAVHMRDFVGNDVEEVSDLTAVPEDFLKIAAYFANGVPESIGQVLSQIASPEMRPVVSGNAWVDFLPQGVNKGTALAILQQKLGVEKAQTMSFGDQENDIELLAQSGIGCAMQNGNTELLQMADRRVDSVAAELRRVLGLCRESSGPAAAY